MFLNLTSRSIEALVYKAGASCKPQEKTAKAEGNRTPIGP